jgi:hypothetical protein
MTRNHLLSLSTKPRPPGAPGVWRMTMDLLGQAFGVPAGHKARR